MIVTQGRCGQMQERCRGLRTTVLRGVEQAIQYQVVAAGQEIITKKKEQVILGDSTLVGATRITAGYKNRNTSSLIMAFHKSSSVSKDTNPVVTQIPHGKQDTVLLLEVQVESARITMRVGCIA
jgi:hypothetical protein